MMGGMTYKTADSTSAAGKKFSVPAPKQRDTAAIRLSDPEQTMAVLHRAFGGDVGGANTRNAAAALGLRGEAAGSDMVALNMKMNVQFLALQNTIQQWNQKGASMSNASKARHEMAMNSVRNLK
jgi:hypothetical protein